MYIFLHDVGELKLNLILISKTLILASADFILTSNDVTKMAIHLKLFAFLGFFPPFFVEFTPKSAV